MTQFLYMLGSILFQLGTLWLGILVMLFSWDVLCSKCRKRRQRLESIKTLAVFTSAVTVLALAGAAVDTYLITPALGSGINFFFAG